MGIYQIAALIACIISLCLLITLFTRLKQISANTQRANEINERIEKYLEVICENQVAAFKYSQKNKIQSPGEQPKDK